jgi:hypothetical protein
MLIQLISSEKREVKNSMEHLHLTDTTILEKPYSILDRIKGHTPVDSKKHYVLTQQFVTMGD